MSKKLVTNKNEESPKPAGKHPWVYLLLGLLLIGMMYGRNLSGDVWWHLKTGQWIVEHKAFPYADPFSYTAKGTIIFHEWAAEVIGWLVYSRISPSALAIMSMLLICAAFVLAFKMALDRSRNPLAAFIVTAVGAAASAGASEMRPQVFSFVFFAIAVLILQRYHERGGRAVWLLVPLIFTWANFHGVFIAGLALIVLEVGIALMSPPEWAGGRRLAPVLTLAGVGVAASLLALINPNGAALYLYPIKVIGNPSTSQFITEWTQPSFKEWTGRSLIILIGIASVGLAIARRKPTFRDFVYVSLFAAASLMARRQAVLFSIACAGPIALWLSGAIDEILSRLSVRRLDVAALKGAWVALSILVAILFFWRVSDASGQDPFDYMNMSEVFPSQVCDFIGTAGLKGNMFNDYNYGGYMIWRLWPEHRDFVDGRTEPFLGGALEDAKAAVECAGPGAWQSVFEKYKINFAVLGPTDPIVAVMAERQDWVPVYEDPKAIVFIRNAPQNQDIIDGYRLK